MSVIKMTDLDLSGKRVLIREDLNVPLKERRGQWIIYSKNMILTD